MDQGLRVGPSIPRRWVLLGLPAGLAAGALAAIVGPIPVVLAIGGLLALAATMAAPGVVFALYLLIPFYKGAVQPYIPVDITVVLALLNMAQIVPVLLDPRPRQVTWIGIALWLAVGLLVLAGVMYAPDQRLALGQAVGYWALVVMPILPAVLRVGADARYIRQLLWTMAAAGIVVVLLGIAQISTSQRLVELGMNTIQVGRAALLVPLLGTTLLIADRRLAVRIAALLLMPAAIVVALASGSRGPLLVLSLMAAYGALRLLVDAPALAGRRIALAGAAVLITAVLLAVVPTLVPDVSLNRFTLFWDFLGTALSGDNAISSADTSAGARVRLFTLAVEMFQDRPLLGAGTAGFEALSPIYVGPIGADAYPHNAVLQFASEFGMVGIALFLGVVGVAIFRPLPGGRIAYSVRALTVFFLLNAMLSGNIVEDRETWALLLLLLVIDPRQLTGDRALPARRKTDDG